MFFNIVCFSSGDCCPACCPSSCNNFTACSLCPPPSSCSQGFHINVEYFHLGQVDIPAQVTERYLTRTLLKVPASLNHCTRPRVIKGGGYWGWSWMGSFSPFLLLFDTISLWGLIMQGPCLCPVTSRQTCKDLLPSLFYLPTLSPRSCFTLLTTKYCHRKSFRSNLCIL